MHDVDEPAGGPPVDAFDSVFDVYETRQDGETLLYFGEPLTAPDTLEQTVWPLFRRAGYEVSVQYRTGEHVLVAEPHSPGTRGVPWTNVLMALLTVGTTLFVSVEWYGLSYSDPAVVLQTWPFAASVLVVLAVHELGHYALSRYYNVEASLPYFIPIPTIFGTMGAVIRMKGRIPSREALFDIGIAGPLAGLVAAVAVTTVGLFLDPVQTGGAAFGSASVGGIASLNYPLLIQGIAALTGQPLTFAEPGLHVNPVVVGGWVGMFVTFLNLLPVGQLDGGHIVRAMLGERQRTVAALVPAVLLGMGAYLHFVAEFALNPIALWFVWGVIAMGLAYAGPASPVSEERIDARRMALGVFTFVLGLLCFTPVPFELAV